MSRAPSDCKEVHWERGGKLNQRPWTRRENKKKQDDQNGKDIEGRGCLVKEKVDNLKESLRERTRQLERILTDCPDFNKSPHVQRFVQESKIKRGIDEYELLWFHYQCQGWIAKDACLPTYL